MTKGNKSRFTNKDELNNQAREKETSSEVYLNTSKTYDSDQTFQKHFAVFLANGLGFPTSSDDKANHGIDVNAAEEVNQPKFQYLKKQWESVPQNQPYLVDQYVKFITEAKEGEEKLGFAKNEQGKFDFPKHFKDFLQKRVEQDWKNNNSEKDVNEYWASKSQNGKDELINQYDKSVNKSKPKDKDLSVEELQQWRDNKINDLHSRYDKRSLQGIKELETVIEYTLSGQGAIKESPSILENAAKTAYNATSTLVSGASSIASSLIGLAGLSSLFGAADASKDNSNSGENSNNSPYTSIPTRFPTKNPTLTPTRSPTENPTLTPTRFPTKNPTLTPTQTPTVYPTSLPSISFVPTSTPTGVPTSYPSPEAYNPNLCLNETTYEFYKCTKTPTPAPNQQTGNEASFFETPGGKAIVGSLTAASLLGLLYVGRKIAKDLAPGTSCKPKGVEQVQQQELQQV